MEWCYGKLRMHLFGVLIIWTVTLVECNLIKGDPETSLITNFVQKLIQPYIQSLQLSADASLRTIHETPVQKAIREVVTNLRPYLQDDYKDNVDSENDTTIIEFLPNPKNPLRGAKEPNSDLQTSINKYEKIKSEIKEALERESVAANTKKMVTRTLDDLIAKVIGNQCTWKSVDHSLAMFRNGKNSKHNITLEEWEDLKRQYFTFLQKKSTKKSLKLFNDFHNFFSKVINDSQTSSDRYKIKCELIKVDADDKPKAVKESEKAQDTCNDFKICSDELKEFLTDFYVSLNDTVVSVFKNFAAMYTRDVISDNEDITDIDSVPTVLDNMGNTVDHRVSKIFIEELKKLKLDEQKNKEENIKILREFIRVTCKNVHKHIKKHLSSDLMSLRARLLLSVEQDINVNLGLDLGNLKTDMKRRICAVFVTCNGRVSEYGKALSDSGKPQLGPLGNRVYVKVQLSLDDKLKDAMVKSNKDLLRSWRRQILGNNLKNQMDYRRSDTLNVTRTTVRVTRTTGIEANNSDINNVLKNSVFEKF